MTQNSNFEINFFSDDATWKNKSVLYNQPLHKLQHTVVGTLQHFTYKFDGRTPLAGQDVMGASQITATNVDWE